MRGLFSLLGLLLVLVVIGLVARQQLTASARKAPPASAASSPAVDTPQQAQQLQKQVQDDVSQLMQNRSADLDQQAEPKP